MPLLNSLRTNNQQKSISFNSEFTTPILQPKLVDDHTQNDTLLILANACLRQQGPFEPFICTHSKLINETGLKPLAVSRRMRKLIGLGLIRVVTPWNYYTGTARTLEFTCDKMKRTIFGLIESKSRSMTQAKLNFTFQDELDYQEMINMDQSNSAPQPVDLLNGIPEDILVFPSEPPLAPDKRSEGITKSTVEQDDAGHGFGEEQDSQDIGDHQVGCRVERRLLTFDKEVSEHGTKLLVDRGIGQADKVHQEKSDTDRSHEEKDLVTREPKPQVYQRPHRRGHVQ